MAQLLQGHLSHTGAQRCGFASKVTLLCHQPIVLCLLTYIHTYDLHTYLRVHA